MTEQRKKILDMLSAGTITANEAERLLSAVEKNAQQVFTENNSLNQKPKFLHVKVEKDPSIGGKHQNVDIKIPIILLKAGMKLGSMIPESSKSEINSHLNSKGIHLDLNSIDSKDLDVILGALAESSIDIDTEHERVKIYCA